jgi:mRNA-degrading endonuclease YafQ of YafQ-DinJ toxin-antitoxin module
LSTAPSPIENVRRDPFKGIGKPEPLKGLLAGFWSRRITADHRFVYDVSGNAKLRQSRSCSASTIADRQHNANLQAIPESR